MRQATAVSIARRGGRASKDGSHLDNHRVLLGVQGF